MKPPQGALGPVRAPRGTKRSCRSWQTEAPMRMLMNNLDPEVAERWQDLVIYGGTGRAARSWDDFSKIVRALKKLRDDETLVVQSGRAAGVFKTHAMAPRVVISNAMLVPHWATWDEFRRLEGLGLTMYGQMTAGSWIYIGTQGILQGTFETFAAAGRRHFGGSLEGRLVLTAGLGGMGGAQPLAATMNGAACIVVEVDEARIDRRIASGYLDKKETSLDRALEAATNGPVSIGLLGNAADVLPEFVRRGLVPDLVTDQTSAHDPLNGYVPAGISLDAAVALRKSNPQEYVKRSKDSMAAHVRAMLDLKKAGAKVFDYGNNIRAMSGVPEAFEIPGFVLEYIRPMFCEGRGPFRWAALSGDPRDIHETDAAILREFPKDAVLSRWIPLARERVKFQGLPARICWLGYGERAHFGEILNRMVAKKKLRAPIVIGRDHLDCGSVASPYRETEGMRDGSDAIADWPVLNALLNASSGATWVSVHHGGGVGIGYSIHAGMVVVADGTKLASKKLELVLTNDPGLGVVRHVDAGYPEAIDFAKKHGVKRP